jgi:uncharacterized surface protein with fasciclin (FAS1) repeats
MSFLKNRRAATIPTLLIGSLLLSACSDDATEPGDQNIVEIAQEAGFSTLVTALEAANLDQTLQGPGPFTVFAPTDAAFAALPAGALDALLADPTALAQVLQYHVVSGDIRSTDLAGVVSAETLAGFPILFDLSSGVRVNDASVTQADIVGSNGVIHVIDGVLLPPAGNIVETAQAAGSFTTLVAALQAASLDDDLAGAGPFTVFAPTDAAFDALPAGTVDALLADPDALADILLYHVVSGQAFAGDLDGTPLATLLGSELTVSLIDGVQINSSNVTQANILTTNGVIHVIDAVLLPPTN